MLAKAVANGARVAEVPIQYRQRIGKKKLKPWHGASIASKMISLAYRLNPPPPHPRRRPPHRPRRRPGRLGSLPLLLPGVPHHLLGTLAIILIPLGGVSIALLPLATTLVRLQAAVARAARRREPPRDCLPPPTSHRPRRRRSLRSRPPQLWKRRRRD